MSQSGSIVFYRVQPATDPPALLGAVLDVARPEFLLSVSRSLEEDRAWEDALRDGEGIAREQLEKGPWIDPALMPRHYVDGRSLTADLAKSPLADRMWDAVYHGIPEHVRGAYGFCPDSLFITIGFHDLGEFAEHEDGLYIARPFLSIRFWGQRTPSDWQSFRERVFQLPEVQAIRRDLEAATGPLQQCVFWSV
jgi:hypothetical protein